MKRIIDGILIEVVNDGAIIREVQFLDDLKTLYRLCHCSIVEMPTRFINGVPYTFIVDEEGLLKDNVITANSTDYREFLVGNILIVRGPIENDGNIHSLTREDIDNILHNWDGLHSILTYSFN